MTTQTAPAPEAIETGSVADQLARLLADTYVLYLKTHAYHWNVTGPHFASLHAMFEQQYLELRDAVDVIAERIRAIGPMAPGSYRQMAELSNLTEDETVPEALDMVRTLADDHDRVAVTAAEALKAAEEVDDQVTVDLATQRIMIHEKTRWMLRAIVG